MVSDKRFEPPDLLSATLAGVVTADDQAEVVEWVRAGIRHLGKVKVLIVLDGFIGWVPGIAIDTSRSWFRDDELVSHLAVVGSLEWRRAVLTLMAQPIRLLPIRYFETETEARQWLGVEARADNTATPL